MPKIPRRSSIIPKTARLVKPGHHVTPSKVRYITIGKNVLILGKKASKRMLRKRRKQ